MNHKLGKHQRAVISPIVDMSPRENIDCIITAAGLPLEWGNGK